MNFRVWAAVLAMLVTVTAGCGVSARREPVNLTLRKAEVTRYLDSGDYEQDVAGVAARASRWIEQRAAKKMPGERLAAIFDIDETALSNWANMERDDFSYIPERWHAWVDRAEGKAIEPVRETYRTARRAEVAVIFLTGRKERDRAATERNLREQGMGEYAELIVKPDSAVDADTGRTWRTAAEFKTEIRRKLIAHGWTIIANIGDQESDLTGGYAEKTFKLPNPFYLTE